MPKSPYSIQFSLSVSQSQKLKQLALNDESLGLIAKRIVLSAIETPIITPTVTPTVVDDLTRLTERIEVVERHLGITPTKPIGTPTTKPIESIEPSTKPIMESIESIELIETPIIEPTETPTESTEPIITPIIEPTESIIETPVTEHTELIGTPVEPITEPTDTPTQTSVTELTESMEPIETPTTEPTESIEPIIEPTEPTEPPIIEPTTAQKKLPFKQTWRSLTELGEEFNKPAAQFGSLLKQYGLREPDGKPSKEAKEGGYSHAIQPKKGREYYLWHREKVIAFLALKGIEKTGISASEATKSTRARKLAREYIKANELDKAGSKEGQLMLEAMIEEIKEIGLDGFNKALRDCGYKGNEIDLKGW